MRSVVYAFFEEKPGIRMKDGRTGYEFKCGAKICKGRKRKLTVWQDKRDKGLTGNLCRHADVCFGKACVDNAIANNSLQNVREGLRNAKVAKDGTVTAFFKQSGKEAVQYSNRSLTDDDSR